MPLRTIDLTELDAPHDATDAPKTMTAEEYQAELRRPRAERRGLSSMPTGMSMTEEDGMRFVESVRRHHGATVASRSRAWANGRDSHCV